MEITVALAPSCVNVSIYGNDFSLFHLSRTNCHGKRNHLILESARDKESEMGRSFLWRSRGTRSEECTIRKRRQFERKDGVWAWGGSSLQEGTSIIPRGPYSAYADD